MSIFDRYVGGIILRSVATVLFVVLALDTMNELLGQMSRIEGNYTFGAALSYVVLQIPGSAVGYLGFAALIGCLIGVGGLSNSSELTVIRAAGVSTLQIVGMVLKPTLVIIVLGMLVSEFIAPNLEQVAQSRRDFLRGNSALQQEHGTWLRDGSDYLHVNAVYPGGELFGVSRFQFVDRKLTSLSFAESVQFQNGVWNEWVVTETRFLPTTTETQSLSNRVWDTELTPDILDMASLSPEHLSLRGLYSYSRYLGLETRFASNYRLAFWTKIFNPLAIAALVLVGLSFVYGASRSVSIGQRIFVGIMVAVVFQQVQDILGPASIIWGFSPIIAVLTPIVITLAIGTFLLRRQK